MNNLLSKCRNAECHAANPRMPTLCKLRQSRSLLLQVTWLNDTNYINLQAEMSGGSKDSWIISFPKDPAALTRFLCTSSTNKCLIEPQTACTPDSAALTGAEVETMSIVGGTSACSAGSGAASVDGTSLSYGLKVSLQAVTGMVSCACAQRLPIHTGEVCM